MYSIFSALARRYSSSIVREYNVITVFNRGTAMFETVAITSITAKSPDHDLDKARIALYIILEEHNLQKPKERLTILLRHGKSSENSLQIKMSRESNPGDKVYRFLIFFPLFFAFLLLPYKMEPHEHTDVIQFFQLRCETTPAPPTQLLFL